MSILRTTEIFDDTRFTLIAVESVDFQQTRTNANCKIYGNIKPIAVIVRGPDGTYTLDMDAKPITYEQLRQSTPEIDAVIALFNL